MTQDTFEYAQSLIHDIKLFEKQRDKVASMSPYRISISELGELGEENGVVIPLGLSEKIRELVLDYYNDGIEKMQKKFELL